MDTLNLDNKFLDFKLFVLPETESLAEIDKNYTIAILVNTDEYDESNQELLKKIIGAMKLNFEQEVFVYKLEEYENIDFNSINCKTLLSFDVSMKRAGVHYRMPKYQLLHYNNAQFLLADSLPKIAVDKNLKGALWNVLKNIG
ncbi:MAG: hypothetical protein AAF806_02025 [Bacteroidota bacterium]